MTSVVNRYYDPSTDQFMSVDPDVATTDQPYVYTNDDPLNSEDPLGMTAAALMGGGYQTAKQQATELNALFQQQLNQGKSIGGGGTAKVVSANGRQYLVAYFLPSKNACVPNGIIYSTVLPTDLKSVESTPRSTQPSGLSEKGALITGIGAGIAGMAGPLLNVSEGVAIIGGGEALTAAGLVLLSGGAALVIIGIGVLLYSAL
jgi:uncharacterized protein RhaS with RHS repeats